MLDLLSFHLRIYGVTPRPYPIFSSIRSLFSFLVFLFTSFVREVFVLPAIKDLILEGPGQRQIHKSHPSFFHNCPNFRMLALRVDFG